jgi:hypothetical protein
MTTNRLPSIALVSSAAALAVCGATLLNQPLSAGSFPAGVGPVGPASLASPLLSPPRIGDVVRSTEATVDRTAADPIGTTDRITDQALTTVRSVRDGAVRTVGTTLNATFGTVNSTVASAVRTVGQVEATALRTVGPVATFATGTVGAVGTLATGTVGQVETIALDRVATTIDVAKTVVGQATTLVVSITKIGASADVDPLTATGTIAVSAGDVVKATAQLDRGSATVTIAGPLTGLTVAYGGDTRFAPSSTTL